MREIKFRMWGGAKYFYDNIAMDCLKQQITGFYDHVKLHDSYFEQYTGKTDINNKEIYEGDKWKRDSFIGIILFKYSGWEIEPAPESPCISYPSFYSNASSGEIIGNIHEEQKS